MSTVSVKDKRWVKTRERLVRTGFDLLSRQSGSPVGVDEIVNHAEISKQTFYNHFADRDAFLAELRLQSRQIFEKVVDRVNAGIEHPVDRLARGVAVHARMAVVDPLHARFFTQFVIRPAEEERALNVNLIADLEGARERGAFAFRSMGAAINFTGAVTQALVSELLDIAQPLMIVPATQEMLMMLLRGLGADPNDAERRATRMTNAIFTMKAEDLLGSAQTPQAATPPERKS